MSAAVVEKDFWVVRLRLTHGDSGGVCLALPSSFAPDHIEK
jgi:hypothetical protein